MQLPGQGLISYKVLLMHLEKRGKDKNWFDTLRTRYKLIHKPIIKPPVKFSSKDGKIKLSRGRTVCYLEEIVPFLDEIIRLHEEEGLTYHQIKGRMQARFKELDEARKTKVCDDKRILPPSLFWIYRIAQIKLKEFYDWEDNSTEMAFLDRIHDERLELGSKYWELANKISDLKKAKEHPAAEIERLEEGKERIGQRIDFYQEAIKNTITQFSTLLKNKKIVMSPEDWKEAEKKAELRRATRGK